MKMKIFFRGCIWPMFRVIFLVVCCQRNASGERAQGCFGSRLGLSCLETKVIQITAVVLGDSVCFWASCCIKGTDCTHNANANHTMDVHRSCDGQRNCEVQVIQEEIQCGSKSKSNSDFERITFNCVDNYSRNGDRDTTKSIDEQTAVDSFTQNTPVSVSSTILGIGIAGGVFLIITIGIVALVFVVKARRKRMKQLRSTEAAQTVDGETDGHETIGTNGAQRICIQTPASEYCELDVEDRGRVQIGSEYVQLNKRQQVRSTDEAKKVDRETNRNKVIDINGDQRTSLETSACVYCEQEAAPIEGIAKGSVPLGSGYLQLC